jgi:type IV secretion system protein VirB10
MSDETTTNAPPMRLRAEPPRVTRLSRKMLAGVGAVALLGIGGALIYALQTRDMSGNGEELYSTENRATADGLAGLPKDYPAPSWDQLCWATSAARSSMRRTGGNPLRRP